MRRVRVLSVLFGMSLALAGAPELTRAQEAGKPNIVVIWGDDVGQTDVSAYSMGS